MAAHPAQHCPYLNLDLAYHHDRGWSGTVFPRKKKAEQGQQADDDGPEGTAGAVEGELAEKEQHEHDGGEAEPVVGENEATATATAATVTKDDEAPNEEVVDEEPPRKKKKTKSASKPSKDKDDKDNKDTDEKSKDKEKSEKPKKEPKKKRHCTETLLIKLFYLQPEPDEWAKIPIGPVKFVREKLPNCLDASTSKTAEAEKKKAEKKATNDDEGAEANTAGASASGSGKQTEPPWAEMAPHLTA